jgi:hypothetical protein
MSITTQTMVVNLQISMWTGHRLDKDASAKVTLDANAEQDAARVNKHLVPKEALKPIQQAATAVRMHFYDKTLPWKDNGDRLLPRKLYAEFIAEHGALMSRFNDAVDQFIAEAYPKACEQAAFRMGDLFKPNDYPKQDELRRRFGITLDLDAVTEASDFRVAMEQEQLDGIRATMQQALQQRINRAMQDVWTRLSDTLGHFTDKMGTDSIFRDSTVKNLEELLDVLPGLNILDDPNIDTISQQIREKLTGYAPNDIRKNPVIRGALAYEAKAIMDQMTPFMNAFGSGEE